MKLRRNTSQQMFKVFVFLSLRHALKQSCHLSVAWSMKLCWLLTTFQSDAASAHWFLINMFLRVGFSRCLQVLVHWCGFHAARGESEWCILLWCLAAQTVAAIHLSSCWWLLFSSAPRVHKSTELLRYNTLNFTPDVANRPISIL